MRSKTVVLLAASPLAAALTAAVAVSSTGFAGMADMGKQIPRDPRPAQARPATDEEKQLQQTIAASGADAPAMLALATLQERRGAVGQAATTLRKLSEMEPANVVPMHALAALYQRAGEFDRAVKILERAAALHPANPSGHHLVATYYYEKSRDPSIGATDKHAYLEHGVAAENRALEADPDFAEALVYKNLLLREQAAADANPARRAALNTEADALRARAGIAYSTSTASATAEVIDFTAVPEPPPPPPVPGAGETQWVYAETSYVAAGNARMPVKVKDVRPVHAPMLIKLGLQGTVVLEATVDHRGRVTTARILEGVPLLTQSAIDAVRQWQFDPASIAPSRDPLLITVTAHYVLPR